MFSEFNVRGKFNCLIKEIFAIAKLKGCQYLPTFSEGLQFYSPGDLGLDERSVDEGDEAIEVDSGGADPAINFPIGLWKGADEEEKNSPLDAGSVAIKTPNNQEHTLDCGHWASANERSIPRI